MKSPLVVLLVCLAATTVQADEGYRLQFTDRASDSEEAIRLRANQKPVFADECGKHVTEPYGILGQTYKLGSAANDEKCSWYLHAPAEQRVNVISVSFVLEDEIKPARSDEVKVSTISVYDGARTDRASLLTTYHVTPQEKVGHLVRSLSSTQDMVVEIRYHDNKDFATQRVLINYEFVDADRAKE